MNHNDVVLAAQAKLRELGVPAHMCSVRKIPARVEINVLIGTTATRIVLRSGITHIELAKKFENLEASWRNRGARRRRARR